MPPRATRSPKPRCTWPPSIRPRGWTSSPNRSSGTRVIRHGAVRSRPRRRSSTTSTSIRLASSGSKAGRAVGLFGAIEVRHVNGPLVLDRTYTRRRRDRCRRAEPEDRVRVVRESRIDVRRHARRRDAHAASVDEGVVAALQRLSVARTAPSEQEVLAYFDYAVELGTLGRRRRARDAQPRYRREADRGGTARPRRPNRVMRVGHRRFAAGRSDLAARSGS